jgi:hypothetical protein
MEIAVCRNNVLSFAKSSKLQLDRFGVEIQKQNSKSKSKSKSPPSQTKVEGGAPRKIQVQNQKPYPEQRRVRHPRNIQIQNTDPLKRRVKHPVFETKTRSQRIQGRCGGLS